jgi:hypothetical protein
MDTTQKLTEDKTFYAKWWNTNEVGSENAKLLE